MSNQDAAFFQDEPCSMCQRTPNSLMCDCASIGIGTEAYDSQFVGADLEFFSALQGCIRSLQYELDHPDADDRKRPFVNMAELFHSIKVLQNLAADQI